MTDRKDGMNYAPSGEFNRVVEPGQFRFAAIALDHGHIYGMCNGLVEAGADLVKVYDPDPEKLTQFCKTYPQAKVAANEHEIMEDDSIQLIAGAAVTSERAALGIRAMEHGKDYFTDKAPMTTLEQLRAVRQVIAKTGRKYMVYYSERLHAESAIYAGQLIDQGLIGRVIQVIGTGPHRLNAPSRPEWFFQREKYGGILCDIGSHQVEQFLYYTGAKDAQVLHSKIANYHHPAHPELDDFGDATLLADNGATGYFRVDWFTPDGLSTWGDGRTIILGTEGFIELRKYVELASDAGGDQVYLVNSDGEQQFSVKGKVGFPFFGQLILDCLHRTEHAMTQEHAFKAAELCLYAQQRAIKVE